MVAGSAGVTAFVVAALPPAPARVLEVGAGDGELAAHLRTLGYDVLAIDPHGRSPAVVPVRLADVDEPAASFDAAVAVVALHHVDPPAESFLKLAELLRPNGPLVIDEFDVERFDDRAARWWIEQRRSAGLDAPESAAMIAGVARDVRPLAAVQRTMAPHFWLGFPVRGAYLHRWDLPVGLRDAEEELIADGRLPATGARLVAIRR
jgi:SAM-dependent methyltransferase